MPLFKRKLIRKRSAVAPEPRLGAFANDLLKSLSAEFPLGYEPELEWRNLRVSAGLAYFREGRIALSVPLLTDETRLENTLRHEYAHLLAVARYGRKAAGHGPHWKQAMIDLGVEPLVRHHYDVKRNQRRQVVVYRCASCGSEFTRRRRLAKGRRYTHAACGGPIRFVEIRAETHEAPTT